ncbi:DarT ssDNA thymidine ADP-ribosyltransferase family protein [Pseudomonas sp. NPDC089741]|uniref:DarT ssDNA thymidine ADP-ribosyltransferase family protein n=1 Tax=Pseudomonas sp. NPDC089741 TaxID=3364470 RepID=UPI0038191019
MNRQCKLSEHSIAHDRGEAFTHRLVLGCIRDLQRIQDCLLSGDDSPLRSIWEEICVQQQGKLSFFWRAYQETVPFHWFAGNPFEGAVQRREPKAQFVLISVYRSTAKQNGWKIVPRHPLAGDSIQLLDYEQGFEAIEWDVMNSREYQDPHCKSICMAECLAPGIVKPTEFFKIFTPNEEVDALCVAKMQAAGVKVLTGVNQRMFYQ